MCDPARKAMEIEMAWVLHDGHKGGYSGSKNRARLRERCSAEQNHRCCYCGVRTNEAASPLHEPTLEHIIPRADGGPDSYGNVAMACWGCNQVRGREYDQTHQALAEAAEA